MKTKVIFFNQWRNGDCFLGKEYVREIVNMFPDIEFAYAHNNYPDIIGDLGIKHLKLDEIPGMGMFTLVNAVAEPDGGKTVYINTWAGCMIPKYMGEKDHANFKLLHNMWREIYQALNVEIGSSFENYLPQIKWEHYHLTECEEYLKRVDNKRLFLFCNSQQQSEQSSMGDMRDIIYQLATEHNDCEFLVTDELDFDLPNVTYCGTKTRDMNASNVIFGPMIVGSLNKISYISQHAELIVGKNSGPFTYAHTKSNMNDSNKTFMCFSHKLKDCLMGEGEFFADSYFSDTLDNDVAIRILNELINNELRSSNKHPTRQLT